MGSEMCIRDRDQGMQIAIAGMEDVGDFEPVRLADAPNFDEHVACLLYTSDAADERSSVDLGGRRIIKKTHRI